GRGRGIPQDQPPREPAWEMLRGGCVARQPDRIVCSRVPAREGGALYAMARRLANIMDHLYLMGCGGSPPPTPPPPTERRRAPRGDRNSTIDHGRRMKLEQILVGGTLIVLSGCATSEPARRLPVERSPRDVYASARPGDDDALRAWEEASRRALRSGRSVSPPLAERLRF